MRKPLAFILWHRRKIDVEASDYDRALADFHRTLLDHARQAFLGSAVGVYDSQPWMKGDGEVYEDWYVVRDFTSLGVLNDVAVDSRHRVSHDETAVRVAEAYGGVYQLEAGSSTLIGTHPMTYWLTRPEHVPSAEYLKMLVRKADSCKGLLWRRQLNLGIATEYALQAPEEIDGPDGVVAGIRRSRRVWPV